MTTDKGQRTTDNGQLPLDERFEALRLELLASFLLFVARRERPNSNPEQVVVGVGVFWTYEKHGVATLFQDLDQRFSVLLRLQGCHLERATGAATAPAFSADALFPEAMFSLF
jgi:hypothetical protein